MKKITLMLLIFLFSFPVDGKDESAVKKDECLIFASPLGGYTLPWAGDGREYYVYLNKDGTLNEKAVHQIAWEISYHGANSVREFPFWPNKNLEIIIKENETIRFQDNFFKNWKKIVEIYNSYGIRIYFELFDFCGTRGKFGEVNPWKIASPAGNFFWGNETKGLRIAYINRMIDTFKDLNVGWGICNEPRYPHVQSQILIDIFCQLIEMEINPKLIILPIEYNLKEQDPKYAKLYRNFREGIVLRLNDSRWRQWLKDMCLSPIHGTTLESIREILGENPPPGGTRNLIFDSDGVKNPRPNKFLVQGWVHRILELKYIAAKKRKIHFAVVYGKQEGDPTDSVAGIVSEYFDFFKKYPYNYNRIKEIHSTIAITIPAMDGEQWEIGESQIITWKSTGNIENVKIQYSIDENETWEIIAETTPNDGIYIWDIPQNIIPGENQIKISDIEEKTFDIKWIQLKKKLEPISSLTIISPNNNEIWTPGEKLKIIWISIGNIGNIKIEKSNDNEKSWTTIREIENNGKYEWKIPENIPFGPCLIRISEIKGKASDTKKIEIKKQEENMSKEKISPKKFGIVAAILIIIGVAFFYPLYTAGAISLLLIVISLIFSKKYPGGWYWFFALGVIGGAIILALLDQVWIMAVLIISLVAFLVVVWKKGIKIG